MKDNKRVFLVAQGKRADIGQYKIDRILPNRFVQSVGPFVFLDHLLPVKVSEEMEREGNEGTGPHPHRGIATLTYVLNGMAEHYDSKGHHATVHSGGVQWMKAGNGIVHDESIAGDPDTDDLLIHSFQFWINLPSKIKNEKAAYLPLESASIPARQLDNDRGWLKIIAGDFEGLSSRIPSYSNQLIYHLHLEAGKGFRLDTVEGIEYAAFLPLQNVVVNDVDYIKDDLLVFENSGDSIEFKNVLAHPVDIIIFGGEHYNEPTVSYGPFVMNTQHEISIAYNDYYEGKYGEISR